MGRLGCPSSMYKKSMKYIFIVLLALSLSQSEGRRLADEMDNEISPGRETDFRKRIVDWVRISEPPAQVLNKAAGTLVELECEAVGSPAPTVQWLKGNRPIIDNESFENNIINDVPSKGLAKVRSRLVIHSVLPAHEATYTCLAESGSQIASAKSKVYVSANDVSDKNFSQLLADELLAARNQPRIILYDTIYMDNIGSDIVLPCKVIGNPRPSIIWLDPKDEVVTNGPRWSVSANGELRIRNIRWNDMGPYTCVARNNLGQDNVTTFLYPMLASK